MIANYKFKMKEKYKKAPFIRMPSNVSELFKALKSNYLMSSLVTLLPRTTMYIPCDGLATRRPSSVK